MSDEKKQVFYVDYDENGDEIKTAKGKGRTRLGYAKGEDGNFYPDPNFDSEAHEIQIRSKNRPVHHLITMDMNGDEISRSVLGKGRPKKDWTKQSNGDYITVIGETPAVTAVTAVTDVIVDADEADTTAEELTAEELTADTTVEA